MNGASIHLLLNHLPVLGLFFGLCLLVWGILGKQSILRTAAYVLLVFASLTTLPVNISGEEAEEIVEEMHDGRSHEIIHEHEEAAELALFMMLTVGLMAIAAGVMQRRNHPQQRLASYATLGLGLVAFGYMAYVANLGGQISHPEIRADFVVPEGHEHHEDDH